MGPTAFEILQELRAIRELLERFAAREFPAEARVMHNSYCRTTPLHAAPKTGCLEEAVETVTAHSGGTP